MRKLGLTLLTVLIALQGLGQYIPKGFRIDSDLQYEDVIDGDRVVTHHGPTFGYTGRAVIDMHIDSVRMEVVSVLKDFDLYYDNPTREKTNLSDSYNNYEDL